MATAVTALIADMLATIAADAILTDLESVASGWRVKVGPLQEDPQIHGVNLMVYPNDPDDEGGWTHGIIQQWPESNPMVALRQLPAGLHEIGGGMGWKRRFVLELSLFLGRTDDDARAEGLALSQLVLASIENGLLSDGRLGPSIKDTFGEQVIRQDNNIIAKSELTGGGQSGIYWGKIWLEISTERRVVRRRVSG